LAGRVVEIPVLVTLTGEVVAGVAAAHRDDDISLADRVVLEQGAHAVADVDADLGQRLNRDRVEPDGGF
jgi:hypothetical protein